MNAFLESMLARAKADRQTIVLPEGDDERTLDAAEKILADDVANLVILGDADAIRASGRALDGARVVDPRTSDLREELAGTLYELRQRKGMTPEQALALMDDVLYFGVMMVKTGSRGRHGGRRLPRHRRRAAPQPADTQDRSRRRSS